MVAESVVVIKLLLQSGSGEDKHAITQLIKLLDKVTAPAARASIAWIAGEYCEKIPLHAPDILRKLAKNFVNEVPSSPFSLPLLSI